MYQIGSQTEKGPSLSDMYMMMVLQLVKLSMVTVRPLMVRYCEIKPYKLIGILHILALLFAMC